MDPPGDAVRLVEASLTAPAVHFSVVYGISANARAWWISAGPTVGISTAGRRGGLRRADPGDRGDHG